MVSLTNCALLAWLANVAQGSLLVCRGEMRLARKSGARGLCGVRARRRGLSLNRGGRVYRGRSGWRGNFVNGEMPDGLAVGLAGGFWWLLS